MYQNPLNPYHPLLHPLKNSLKLFHLLLNPSLNPLNPSTIPLNLSQTFELDLTFPTIYEVFAKFLEKIVARLKKLSEESRLRDNLSEIRTHWNEFLRWMTSEVFKLKGLSEQVINDHIRGAEERLEARLAQQAEERSKKEAEERAKKELLLKLPPLKLKLKLTLKKLLA